MSDIGMIGMAVMGQSLSLNIERNGFSVSVYNITPEETETFLSTRAKNKNIKGFKDLESFVNSLKRPRKVMLMIKAGDPVDQMISKLIPLLEKGDLIIDGGNSFFKDTIRREKELYEKGIFFIGTGVSGGEEGALNGPSLMPGGRKEAYDLIKDIFLKIAAKVKDKPCCAWIGENGAGHYVKMVHNGIEYADMQLICEAYSIIKNLLGFSNEEIAEIFKEWNESELSSYLIEITSKILKVKDPLTGKDMVDVILDKAGQKGTGMWTSQNSLELGVSASVITEAVFARYLSAIKKERVEASKILKGPAIKSIIDSKEKKRLTESVKNALYASKICSYAQGFYLMKEASKVFGWNLNLGEIAMIWRGGCIIRAQFLERIKDAYEKNSELKNLMLDDYFKNILENSQSNWREIIALAIYEGLPIQAFCSAISYYDGYRSEILPANLIQAQRDYFGAHTYERIDKPGVFHTEWKSLK